METTGRLCISQSTNATIQFLALQWIVRGKNTIAHNVHVKTDTRTSKRLTKIAIVKVFFSKYTNLLAYPHAFNSSYITFEPAFNLRMCRGSLNTEIKNKTNYYIYCTYIHNTLYILHI